MNNCPCCGHALEDESTDTLKIHPELMAFSIDNVDLQLSVYQYKFLKCLFESPGEPVTREGLSQFIYGREHDSFSRSIDDYATRVRKALELSKYTIKHIRFVGYMLIKNELDQSGLC